MKEKIFKKGISRRFLSVVLALAMALSLMPTMKMTVLAADEHNHSGWTSWENNNSLPSVAGNYVLNCDVTLSNTWDVKADTTNLCLNGYVIKMVSGEKKSVIHVYSNATLNLYDCNPERTHSDVSLPKGGVITGGKGNVTNTGGTDGGGVFVGDYSKTSADKNSTFNMYGGTITGNEVQSANNYDGLGGGVYVRNAHFNMYGGTITGNKAVWGGGVANETAAFTMSGGKIFGNIAKEGGGGGVHNTGSGTFDMSGGTIGGETANTAKWGGGVFVSGDVTFNLTNGVISNNIATNMGGGVHNKGTFTMSGGTIKGNKFTTDSTGSGGGVGNELGTFTMTGGTIGGETANTAKWGGGVCVNGGTFNMVNGAIINNKAVSEGYGGGVYNKATLNVSGGTISGNTTTRGGGVYQYVGSFTMSGGTIGGETANTATWGGGVFISNGTFNLTNGEIRSNQATSWGGGVYNCATFTMLDGTISANKTKYQGGGVVNDGGTLKMYGGSISSNETENGNGGGVYAHTNQNVIIIGGTANIANNKKGSVSSATDNNVYLSADKYITIGTGSNAPTNGMSVYINGDDGKVFVNEGATENHVQYFHCDDENMTVELAEGKLKLSKRPHEHGNWTYEVKNDNQIEATCGNSDCDLTSKPIITLSANSANYSGSAYTGASITGWETFKTATGLTTKPQITYYKVDTAGATTGGTVKTADQVGKAQGNYYAKITVGGVSAVKPFTISAHVHQWTFTTPSADTLKAHCGKAGHESVNDAVLILTVTSKVHNGKAVTANFVSGNTTLWEMAGLTVPTITYEAKTGSALTGGKAVNVGSYTAKASYTVGGDTYTITKDFAITPKSQPKTGVMDTLPMWFGVMAVSAAAYVLTSKKRFF